MSIVVESAYDCLIPECGNMGIYHAPNGSGSQWLCATHYRQFLRHLLDPACHPIFPPPLE